MSDFDFQNTHDDSCSEMLANLFSPCFTDSYSNKLYSNCYSGDLKEDIKDVKEDLFSLYDMKFTPLNSFQNKYVEQWNLTDFKNWIMHYADSVDINFQDISLHSFNNWKESELTRKDLNDFILCDPIYGQRLFIAFQEYIHSTYEQNNNRLPSIHNLNSTRNSYDLTWPSEISSIVQDVNSFETHIIPNVFDNNPNDSDEYSSANNTSDGEEPPILSINPTKIKRPVGRPRGRKSPRRERKGKIWEFIRNMLHDPEDCPRIIRWEDHKNGIFRFVNTDEVAKKWGCRNNNSKMTYDKLSRAMRYYYSKGILEAVPEKRLVYKFGPNATGWFTENPNFGYNYQ